MEPIYDTAERIVCEHCPEQNSTSCKSCIVKMAYDAWDDLAKKQYYKEYRAVCEIRRDKVHKAIEGRRKEKRTRKRW